MSYTGTRVARVASGEKDRPTTVNALVYAFYSLVVLVVIVAVLWLSGVVLGWVVPAVLAVTAIVASSCCGASWIVSAGRCRVAFLRGALLPKPASDGAVVTPTG